MKTFGASAPLKELQKKFEFEPDQVVSVAKELLGRKERSDESARLVSKPNPAPAEGERMMIAK